jgi:hypothetical protein
MSYLQRLILLLSVAVGLVACGDPATDAADADGSPVLSDAARFDRDMSKKGCELLTAELVAATFDVAADQLKQYRIMGCRYTMQGDTDTVEAAISMIRAYDSEAAAGGWFANATRNRTAEEMAAEMNKISGQLDKQAALDTAAKKSAAKNLLASVDAKAISFEDVAGIGDEARVSDQGTVYVRVDNLTFMVTAYKGARAPQPDLSGLGTDLKQIAARVKESESQWMLTTLPQRKRDATLLAGKIVAEL